MQFFDFNIPYLEDSPSGKTTPSERAARKKTRLKLVVKAVELGYSGVAYNRSIKGVMSESDRCSISLFPLSSLLSLSPSLASSASFHRRLLSGPHAARSPFRQYTRVTVSVDNPSQSSALNSGNPILKTYDLVAVRPMNQDAFDQACQFSEVDLIAIDLSHKMPFRLKLPMVKAAIARGVYFEIAYSSLIVDIQVRRQVISNAKLLVDWTHGKNLIVTSAAPSVLEFRGPNDVANLLSLLGLATEHAKAAVSKNCRSLIAKTLTKKQFLKEAVRVNMMPSVVKSDPKKPWIIDSMEWDPISSGEGDLLLEDLAKSFSEATKKPETLKPNGHTTSVKIANFGGEVEEFDDANDSVASFKEPMPPSETEIIRFCSQQKPVSLFSIPLDRHRDMSHTSLKSCISDSENDSPAASKEPMPSSETEKIRLLRKPVSLFSIPLDHRQDVSDTSLKPSLSESKNACTDSVNTTVSSIASESRPNSSDILDIDFIPIMRQEDQKSIFSQGSNILNTESIQKNCNDVEAGTAKQRDSEVSAQSNDVLFVPETTQPMMVDVDDVNTDADLQIVTGPSPLIQMDLKEKSDLSLISTDFLIEEASEVKECKEIDRKVSSHDVDEMVDLDSVDEWKDGDNLLDTDRVPQVNGGLPVEEKRHKEVDCRDQETNINLYTNSDGMSHVNPSERMSSSNDLLIHDSLFHGEDKNLEGETLAEANFLSTSTTRLGKRRIQQRGYIRFPFKHILQVPFKRKAVASRHMIRKR